MKREPSKPKQTRSAERVKHSGCRWRCGRGVSTHTVASEASTESKEPLKKAIAKLNTFVITTTRYRSQPDETHQTFRQRDQRAKPARY